jgi:SynChlorMet cassette protein ScmD
MNNSENPIGNPEVVLREEFDEWAVLFNPDTADAVGINPVGVTIWKLMDGKHSVEEIINKIRDRFADVPENSFEHVTSFVNSLADKGFVGYELKGSGK